MQKVQIEPIVLHHGKCRLQALTVVLARRELASGVGTIIHDQLVNVTHTASP
jgi:hypothetical protein